MSQKNPGVKLRWEVRPKIFEEEKRKSLILLMQTVPGAGEATPKFPRNYAELYWESNEPIPRPLSGQEVPQNGGLIYPFILCTQIYYRQLHRSET